MNHLLSLRASQRAPSLEVYQESINMRTFIYSRPGALDRTQKRVRNQEVPQWKRAMLARWNASVDSVAVGSFYWRSKCPLVDQFSSATNRNYSNNYSLLLFILLLLVSSSSFCLKFLPLSRAPGSWCGFGFEFWLETWVHGIQRLHRLSRWWTINGSEWHEWSDSSGTLVGRSIFDSGRNLIIGFQFQVWIPFRHFFCVNRP